MEAFTLLLSSFILIIAMLFLFPSSNKKSQRLTKMLNEIPGPPSYPLIGSILPFVFKKRNELFAFIQENIKNQAPLFRTWNGQEPIVHLTRPEHIEVILRSSEYLDKSFVYNFLHRWLGTGLLTSTGQKWHSHRKMITPTFHFKILDNFLEVFSEQSEILVRKLQKEAGGSGFDVYPYITKCALDIICETAMGTSIYAQDNADSDYVKAVYDMSEITVRRMFKPWLHPNVLFKLSQMGRRHDECLKVLHSFTNRVIRERKSQLEEAPSKTPTTSGDEDMLVGKKKRKAFLDLLLEASLNGVKLTDEELREEVDTFMFEGHDTTSAGMCWTLFLFGLHPDVQEKAYQELQSIFQDSDRSPTMKDLADMKYLEQVIKEALRLYPSVPMFGRKLFADVKIGDYTIPAGTTINIHAYRVHRCPDQFPDPEKFDPDNFLSERIAKRHPYAYIPFSAGPRNCIGQKFALLEEKTVLSYILRHYKVKSLEKREDINLIGELILRPENGIKLSITSRKTMKNNV